MKMKKTNKRIVSIFLTLVLIAMLIPLSGIIATAEPAKQIQIHNGTEWKTYNLVEGVVLPEGMTYDHTFAAGRGRIILNGYDGGPIRQVNDGTDYFIAFYLEGDSTINGGDFEALNFNECINIFGDSSKKLIVKSNNPVAIRTASFWVENIKIDVILENNSSLNSSGILADVEIAKTAKFTLNLKEAAGVTGTETNGIKGELYLNDESSAEIIIDANGVSSNVYGVDDLVLNTNGKCHIKIENSGAGTCQAIKNEPAIFGYDEKGAWNSTEVLYTEPQLVLATQIEIYNDVTNNWEVYDLNETETFPKGMSWDSKNQRLQLENYNGNGIRGLFETEDILKIYVIGENTIVASGDENASIGRFGAIIIDGEPNSKLNSISESIGISAVGKGIKGFIEVSNVNISVTVDNSSSKIYGLSGVSSKKTTLNDGVKLTVDVKDTEESCMTMGVSGKLILNGDAETSVIVETAYATTVVYGIQYLYLNGVGDCHSKIIAPEGVVNFSAIKYEAYGSSFPIYEATGAWDSKEVLYSIPNKPVITEGSNSKWAKGSADGLTFKSNGEFEEFDSVKVDSKELAKGRDYDVKEGSTVVTLKKPFLEALAEGKHLLEVIFDRDGLLFTAKTEFEITEEIAQTGDANSLVSQLALVTALGGLAVVAGIVRRKEEK